MYVIRAISDWITYQRAYPWGKTMTPLSVVIFLVAFHLRIRPYKISSIKPVESEKRFWLSNASLKDIWCVQSSLVSGRDFLQDIYSYPCLRTFKCLVWNVTGFAHPCTGSKSSLDYLQYVEQGLRHAHFCHTALLRGEQQEKSLCVFGTDMLFEIVLSFSWPSVWT